MKSDILGYLDCLCEPVVVAPPRKNASRNSATSSGPTTRPTTTGPTLGTTDADEASGAAGEGGARAAVDRATKQEKALALLLRAGRGLHGDSRLSYNPSPPNVPEGAALVRGLCLVLEQHGIDLDLASVGAALLATTGWPTDKFTAYAKYVSVWPLSVYMEASPLAPRAVKPADFPDGDPWLFGGSIRRYLKRLMLHPSSKKLWIDWYSARRSNATVSPDYVAAAMVSHAQALSAVEPPAPPTQPGSEMATAFATVFSVLLDGPDERPFPPPRIDPECAVPLPTTACLTGMRAHGGKQVSVLHHLASRHCYEPLPALHLDSDGDLAADSEDDEKYADLPTLPTGTYDPWRPRVRRLPGAWHDLAPPGIDEKTGKELPPECWGAKVPPQVTPDDLSIPISDEAGALKPHLLLPSASVLYNRALSYWREDVDFRSAVAAVPILEPNKVRMITAGSDVTSYILRGVQRAMLPICYRSPLLRLTHQPEPTCSDVLDLRTRSIAFWAESGVDASDWWWVSGDYQGATDKLRQFATLLALDGILSRLRPPGTASHSPPAPPLPGAPLAAAVLPFDMETVRAACTESLTKARIIYKGTKATRGKPARPSVHVMQSTGQLMGNELSFIILCVVNIISLLLAVVRRLHGPNWFETSEGIATARRFLELAPGLINGDDIGFLADAELYQHWLASSAELGFVPSVGKNFFHPRIFCINSQFFDITRASGGVVGPSIATEELLNDGTTAICKHHPFNTGLLVGCASETEKMERWAQLRGRDEGPLALPARYNYLQRSATDHVALHVRFLWYWKPDIRAWTLDGRFNLHGSPALGGGGFNWYPGIDAEVTRFQRVLAAFLLHYYRKPRRHQPLFVTQTRAGERGEVAVGERSLQRRSPENWSGAYRAVDRFLREDEPGVKPVPLGRRSRDKAEGDLYVITASDDPTYSDVARADIDITPRDSVISLLPQPYHERLPRYSRLLTLLHKRPDRPLMDAEVFLTETFRLTRTTAYTPLLEPEENIAVPPIPDDLRELARCAPTVPIPVAVYPEEDDWRPEPGTAGDRAANLFV